MAATNLAIHIPPDANPNNISALVRALAKETEAKFSTVQELLEFAESSGIGSRTEMQFTATKLGLIERSTDGIRISSNGKIFASTKVEVSGDILHFLMYCCWNKNDPSDFLPSWTYKTCCDAYWNAISFQLTEKSLDQRVEEIINQANNVFSSMGFELSNGISFGRKSLIGFHKWIGAVNPLVLEDKLFSRRAFCPPELLILAIGHIIKEEDTSIDIDILLSRERREAICRICLLEPDALDRALDWMIPIYPKVIEKGTSAGYYGRFIRLHKIPTIEDVVR